MLDDNLKKAQATIGVAFIKELGNQLKSAGKNSSGALINSLSYNIIEQTKGFTLQILALPYLTNVNDGRRKGAKPPPVKNILPWIKAKGINFGKTPLQTAYIIARGISKNGIKSTNVIQKTEQIITDSIEDILYDAAKKDVLIIIDNGFKIIK